METSTGSQEVQQNWQTDAISQHREHNEHPIFHDFKTFLHFIFFLSKETACNLGPSGEQRTISSIFVGVVIRGKFFAKLLKLSIVVFH